MTLIKVKDVEFENWSNYKDACLFICFPYCTWKCEKENGMCCQNRELGNKPNKTIDIDKVVEMFVQNPITSVAVLGGLEPFDTEDALLTVCEKIREKTNRDIIIYSGYTEEEITNRTIFKKLQSFPNIIIKFGRYIPNSEPVFDEILGIELASNNQYAKKIS